MSPKDLLICFSMMVLIANQGSLVYSDEITINEVKRSWQNYTALVKSLQSTFAVTKTEEIDISGSGDPFDKNPRQQIQEAVVTLKSQLELTFALPRIACIRSGELMWDFKAKSPKKETQASIFDGKQSKTLLPGPMFPVGEITTGKVVDELGRSIDLMGPWLAYSPDKFFQFQPFYDYGAITLTEGTPDKHGLGAIKLSVPAKNNNAMHASILLEPKTHRIIAFNHIVESIIRRHVELSYQDESKCGWIVSTWKIVIYDNQGFPQMSVKGELSDYSINSDLDPGVFDIDFPDGCQVLKDGLPYRPHAQTSDL